MSDNAEEKDDDDDDDDDDEQETEPPKQHKFLKSRSVLDFLPELSAHALRVSYACGESQQRRATLMETEAEDYNSEDD